MIDDSIQNVKDLRLKKEYEEALQILEALLIEHPKNEKIRKELINTLLEYGGYLNDEWNMDFEGAKKAFKRIIEIDPLNYRALYNLGLTYANLKKCDQALETFDKSIEIKPDYYHCYYSKGYLYETLGELEKALFNYEKALKINPKFLYALHARDDLRRTIDETDQVESSPSSIKVSQNRTDHLKQLTSLFKMSRRVKIDIIQEILNLSKSELINLILEWGENYQFELDGEELIINKETLPDLLKDLQ